MFQTKFVEKIKAQILHPVTFFSKIFPFMRKCEKYCRARQVEDDNTSMLIACRLFKFTNTPPPPPHTHRLCNTHCFSTATRVAHTHLNVSC